MTKKTNLWDPLNEQIDRIRSEYREMPGLRLTFEQMLRLWRLDRRTGRGTSSKASSMRDFLRLLPTDSM